MMKYDIFLQVQLNLYALYFVVIMKTVGKIETKKSLAHS